MEAVPLRSIALPGVCATEGGSAREKHGRLFSCVASGLLLTAAFISHALHQGTYWPRSRGKRTGAPIFAVVLYLSAVLAGGWFIFPKALYAAKKAQAGHEPSHDRGGPRCNRSRPMAGGRFGKLSFRPGAAARIMERWARRNVKSPLFWTSLLQMPASYARMTETSKKNPSARYLSGRRCAPRRANPA